MRTAFLVLIVWSFTSILSADEQLTTHPLEAHAFYTYTDSNRLASVGDTVRIEISVKNVSTNLTLLSLDADLYYTYEGTPQITVSNSVDETTGTETSWIAAAAGGSVTPLHGGPTISSRKDATAYVYLQPGKSWRRTVEFVVPPELGKHHFTGITFRGNIISSDSGSAYGLNAWTGELTLYGCTIPLRQTNQEKAHKMPEPGVAPAPQVQH